MKKTIFILSVFILVNCTSQVRRQERTVASSRPTSFDYELRHLGLNVFYANLHAHHFMSYGEPTKKQIAAGDIKVFDASQAGNCPDQEGFPQDDGRPCRNDVDGVNSIITAPADALGVTNYLKMACDYAREKGELDILFVTPHTKNNQQDATGRPAADTLESEMMKRQQMMAGINSNYKGAFFCGLGQEASSISAGNHVGIFGQFRALADSPKPLLFKSGAFNDLYPQVKQRVANGEPIVLQLNHPDFRRDMWWGDVSSHDDSKDFFKKHLNDYGIDDYAPMKCVIGGPKVVGVDSSCPTSEGRSVDDRIIRQTYANIRAANADRFRLIEIVPTAGATHTTTENFKRVRNRASAYSFGIPDAVEGEKEEDGDSGGRDPFQIGADHLLYDYIYYLNMGFKLGPTANQDNHHMNWGSAIASRTGIVAPSLSEADVLTAMENRRTFASEDRNAKVIFYAKEGSRPSGGPLLMGSESATRDDKITLTVSYYDPDSEDSDAYVRIYYYRQAEALSFDYRSDPADTIRLLDFTGDSKAVLPRGPLPKGVLRDPNRSIAIASGQTLKIEMPLEPGMQYAFVELTQKRDFDKLWTAPVWLNRQAPVQ